MENNSHCVRNEIEMKLIEDMLSAIAAHQFQKEKWFHFDFWSKLHSKPIIRSSETVQNTCDTS